MNCTVLQCRKSKGQYWGLILRYSLPKLASGLNFLETHSLSLWATVWLHDCMTLHCGHPLGSPTLGKAAAFACMWLSDSKAWTPLWTSKRGSLGLAHLNNSLALPLTAWLQGGFQNLISPNPGIATCKRAKPLALSNHWSLRSQLLHRSPDMRRWAKMRNTQVRFRQATSLLDQRFPFSVRCRHQAVITWHNTCSENATVKELLETCAVWCYL